MPWRPASPRCAAAWPALPARAACPCAVAAHPPTICLPLQVRDPWFQLANDALDASLASGGTLRGWLFWCARCGWGAGGGAGGGPGFGRQLCGEREALLVHLPSCVHLTLPSQGLGRRDRLPRRRWEQHPPGERARGPAGPACAHLPAACRALLEAALHCSYSACRGIARRASSTPLPLHIAPRRPTPPSSRTSRPTRSACARAPQPPCPAARRAPAAPARPRPTAGAASRPTCPLGAACCAAPRGGSASVERLVGTARAALYDALLWVLLTILS